MRIWGIGVGGSVLLTVLIGLLGPSAMVPSLSGPAWHPPYSLDLRPDGHLVIAMAVAAITLGAAGLAAGLADLRRRGGIAPWDARWPVAAGCAVAGLLAFLPPSGSSDHLNYAAYGRIGALGLDPYAVTPARLAGDPVAGAVEEWVDTPSVYGPVATAVQVLAGHIGGGSVSLTVFALEIANAAAFIGTALLLHRITRGDPRAALLWAANPLVIYQLSAGMHVDTLAIAAVVAALVVRRRTGGDAGPRWRDMLREAAAGTLLGAGIAVKVNVGLVALGPAWELRRSPRRLAAVAAAATAAVLLGYALAGPHSLDQVRRASKSVSLATPWNMIQSALQQLLGPGGYVIWIQMGAIALMAFLAWGLLRAMPDPTAAQVAAVLIIAYLFAAPYALPWYDGLAFALLALVPVSALDGFMVARMTALSLAYLPARVAEQPQDLLWLRTVVREQVAPWILLILTIALAVWAWRRPARRAAGRAPTPRASAAPRP
ncbi:glycosyltransferase 87 family protein [Thermostaphylospora chromogena]|uniref:Alpha-1,6-mannosyltransferase n=1 Tax=Thermostaphylospora chromogena TaxID=35622 RepID=A0A1H1CV26_9ACTN|nr:glycosyltransferase 87 family protein [Thermostaphylospora chromogena]SDQ68115.1 Protein of unknown function [Thermostaphylospora chromogena]